MATGGRQGQQRHMRKQYQDLDLVWTLPDLLSLLAWLASPAPKAAAVIKPSSARRKSKKRAPPRKSESADSSVAPDTELAEVESAFEVAQQIQALPRWLRAVGLPPTPSEILQELSRYVTVLRKLGCLEAASRVENGIGNIDLSKLTKLKSDSVMLSEKKYGREGLQSEERLADITGTHAEVMELLRTALPLKLYHDMEFLIHKYCRDFDKELSARYYCYETGRGRPEVALEAHGAAALHTRLESRLQFLALHAELVLDLTSKTSLETLRTHLDRLRKALKVAEEYFLKEIAAKGGCDPKGFKEFFWSRFVDVSRLLEMDFKISSSGDKVIACDQNLLSELVASEDSRATKTKLPPSNVRVSLFKQGESVTERWLVETVGIFPTVSRTEETAELVGLLESKASRILIVGESGVGKTSLAATVAHKMLPSWPHQYIFQCTTEDTFTESLRVFALENRIGGGEAVLLRDGVDVDQSDLIRLVRDCLGVRTGSFQTAVNPLLIILDDVADWGRAQAMIEAIASYHAVVVTSCQHPPKLAKGRLTFDKTIELSVLTPSGSLRVLRLWLYQEKQWRPRDPVTKLGSVHEIPVTAAKKRSDELFLQLSSFMLFKDLGLPLVMKTAAHLFRGSEEHIVLEKLKVATAAQSASNCKDTSAPEAQHFKAIECIVDVAMDIHGGMAKDTVQLLALIALLAQPTVPEWFFEGIATIKHRKERLENLDSLGLVSLQKQHTDHVHIYMHELQRQAFVKNHLPSDEKEIETTLRLIRQSIECRVTPLTAQKFRASVAR